MAQLNSRGTLTRARWDYFEHSNGVAEVYGAVASGIIGAYFANNSSGATAIDVYTINWSASVSAIWVVALLPPPLVITPLTPSELHIFSLQADAAQPPGVVGMYTTLASSYSSFVRYSGGSNGAQLAPIMGSYFVTLPPGWAITVVSPSLASACELSMTTWYQYVTDNIAPAV